MIVAEHSLSTADDWRFGRAPGLVLAAALALAATLACTQPTTRSTPGAEVSLADDLSNWADGRFFSAILQDLARRSDTESRLVDEARGVAEAALRRHADRVQRLPSDDRARLHVAIRASLGRPASSPDPELLADPKLAAAYRRLVAWGRARASAVSERYVTAATPAASEPLALAADGSNLFSGELVAGIVEAPRIRGARDPASAVRAMLARELVALRRHARRLPAARLEALQLAWRRRDPAAVSVPALRVLRPLLEERAAGDLAAWLVRRTVEIRTDLLAIAGEPAPLSPGVERILAACSPDAVEREAARLWKRRHAAALRSLAAPDDPLRAAEYARELASSSPDAAALAAALEAERAFRAKDAALRARILAGRLQRSDKAALVNRLPGGGPCG